MFFYCECNEFNKLFVIGGTRPKYLEMQIKINTNNISNKKFLILSDSDSICMLLIEFIRIYEIKFIIFSQHPPIHLFRNSMQFFYTLDRAFLLTRLCYIIYMCIYLYISVFTYIFLKGLYTYFKVTSIQKILL